MSRRRKDVTEDGTKAAEIFVLNDRNFRAAVYDENNRVCWGPRQIRKDTRQILTNTPISDIK